MRAELVAALGDALRATVDDVHTVVNTEWPDAPALRHIFIAEVSENPLDRVVQAVNRWIRDDEVTITVACVQQVPGLNGPEARAAGQQLVDWVETAVFAQHETVMADVEAAAPNAMVLDVWIGAIRGPNVEPLGNEPGYGAFATVDVMVHGRRESTPL